MSQLIVRAGEFTFQARFEEQLAPKTVAAFRKAMPFESQAIHVRWSGEGVWMPLGDLDFGVSDENHTSYPAPGQIILYPGGISETEILLAYGGRHLPSQMGQPGGTPISKRCSNMARAPASGGCGGFLASANCRPPCLASQPRCNEIPKWSRPCRRRAGTSPATA